MSDTDGNRSTATARPAGAAPTTPRREEAAHGPAGAAPTAAERQRLEAELEASRRRVDQLARAYQELNKDREEFKQRLTRERERMLDVERGNVATTLLEAIDELDRASP